jgi:hypothetical protein
MRVRFGVGVVWAAAAVVSCSPATDQSSLSVRLLANPLPAGQATSVVVTATARDGSVGTGKVTIESTVGSLVGGVEVVLDTYGSARADFVCADPCSNLKLTAKWAGLEATTSVKVVAATTTTTCDFGNVTSLAGPGTLDLFGVPLYFNSGAALAPGTYRIRNTGGCMKYGAGQRWTVHAFTNGDIAWWLIGATTADQLFVPPGTFLVTPNGTNTGYDTYAECDAANKSLAPKEFAFAGGKLGVWLKDTIYGDNTSGTGSNPSWSLALVAPGCP